MKDYFHYLNEIVGIKSVMIEPNVSDFQKFSLLIKVQNLSTYNADAMALLEKMITALGLEKDGIKVADYDLVPSNLQPEYILSFVLNPDLVVAKSINEIVTYSPEVLLKNPQLKKQAWDQMQKIVAQLKAVK
jgi:DNA polymerase III psi subunit